MARFIDISGQKKHMLTAVKPVGRSGLSREMRWECVCDCGAVIEIGKSSFGRQKSCGCVMKGRINHFKHNHSKRGLTTPEYRSWATMKQRCTNPRNPKFPRYGGRGISICKEWIDSFEQFYADMGPRPVGFSIERVDVNGNYEPSNCIWASPKTQANNKTSNRVISHKGKTMTTSQWADHLGISFVSLRMRLHRGWDIERALA